MKLTDKVRKIIYDNTGIDPQICALCHRPYNGNNPRKGFLQTSPERGEFTCPKCAKKAQRITLARIKEWYD